MCHREFDHIGKFSEYKENRREDTFACVKCKMIRSANVCTCLSCIHYNTSESDSTDYGICLIHNRKVEFADHCKQYEEDDE